MSAAGVNYYLVRLTQQQQQTTQHKKDNTKMAKKNIKVRDLKPKKDAKGGGGSYASMKLPDVAEVGL